MTFPLRRSSGDRHIKCGHAAPAQCVQACAAPPRLNDFLKEELAALSRLKNILTGKKVIPQKDVDATIMSILKQREYLYIHFPDGYAPSCEKQFLNRVRIEIDYFIKIIKVELNF